MRDLTRAPVVNDTAAHPVEERSANVLIIGAGQAGLGTAYWPQRLGVAGVQVVDATQVGNSWLDRIRASFG